MKRLEERTQENDRGIEGRSKQMTGEPDYQDQLTTKPGMGMAFSTEAGHEISPEVHGQNRERHKEHSGMDMDHEMGEISVKNNSG